MLLLWFTICVIVCLCLYVLVKFYFGQTFGQVYTTYGSSNTCITIRPIYPEFAMQYKKIQRHSFFFVLFKLAVGSIWGRIGYWLFRLLWLWKKLFKILAFSFSSELIQPSFSRGGIDVLDCGEMKVLRTVHQSLAESSPLVSFEAVLSWNNVYPCKPQFYYIKVGFKGVKII